MSSAQGEIGVMRERFLARCRQLLPQGGSLPEEEWNRRHRALLSFLWFNALVLPVYGAVSATDYGIAHTLEHAGALVVMGVLGSSSRLSPKLRSAAVSIGLLSAAALLVHLTGGLIEAHFYFFVMIVALTLYEDWLPFLLAVGFVLLHHGVVGTMDPQEVYNRPEAWEHPWRWAGIHAFFVALAGVAGVAAWRLNENVRQSMRSAQRELATLSETDSLTQLANRRKAMSDLSATFESEAAEHVLIVLDLDGFKSYNDTFGHPAGDALLTRLGERLARAVSPSSSAYRLGGDEFCVLATVGPSELPSLEAAATEALSETGGGFEIGASFGSVQMPSEADSPEEALRIADRRMYEQKDGGRRSAMEQSKDVLLQALAERRPDLSDHLDGVRDLVEPVASDLGMSLADVTVVIHASELHDIGKVAIPDSILDKPGKLDESEWEFIKRHTLIGERIVAAAPALSGVGQLVRSSHERWDGTGYPDGLAGSEIPLGARIICVCDAYDAMLSDRPYARSLSSEDAVQELRRCAGSQFDPAVVDAFEAALAEAPPKPTPTPGQQRVAVVGDKSLAAS